MPCHSHSTFSAMDGLKQPTEHARAAREQGLPGIALTDHGSTSGWYRWEEACREEGVNPVFGVEAYFVEDRIPVKGNDGKLIKDGNNHHLVLLAKNEEGLKSINRICSEANDPEVGYYKKPRIDWSVLRRYSEGVIATSACVGGAVGHYVYGVRDSNKEYVPPNHQAAREWLGKAFELWGEDFYLELQPHPFDKQWELNEFLCKSMPEEFVKKLVVSNDSHYPRPEDADYHDISVCVQTGSHKDDPDRMRYLWDHSIKGLEQLYEDIQTMGRVEERYASIAMENTERLMRETVVELPRGVAELAPSYENATQKLRERLVIGREKKVLRNPRVPDEKIPEYDKRLRYEANLLKDKGFEDYFLVVAELMEAAKGPLDISCGPARGSAGGSLVSYLLDITEVDPIRHKLSFERFISPDRGGADMTLGLSSDELAALEEWWEDEHQGEGGLKKLSEMCRESERYSSEYDDRIEVELRSIGYQEIDQAYHAMVAQYKTRESKRHCVAYLLGITDDFDPSLSLPQMSDLPDIDSDFHDRAPVVKWLKDRWGEDYVYDLANYTHLGIKESIERTGKAFGVRVIKDVVDEIANHYPSISDFLDKSDVNFLDYHEGLRPGTKQVLEYAAVLEGNVRSLGGTAAGVVVSALPVLDYASLCYFPKTKGTALSVDKVDAEAMGLIKIDVLGLKAMKILRLARDIALERGEEPLPLWTVPIDGPEIKDIVNVFKNNETDLIFQFNKPPMRRLLGRLKPTTFEEIVAATALVRTGADDVSYIDGKKGKRDLAQAHPLVREVLSDTYGTLVYQEQAMALCRKVGRMKTRDVNLVRKLTSKKIATSKNMARPKRTFVRGALKNGLGIEEAEQVWETIERTGSYSFNLSHSVAYTMIAWEQAYYQTYHPVAWTVANLQVQGDESDTAQIRKYAFKQGVLDFIPPHVNRSEWHWSYDGNTIIPGFSSIRGIGPKQARTIVSEREKNGPYEDMEDFMTRLKGQGIGPVARELLIMNGAAPEHDGDPLVTAMWYQEYQDIVRHYGNFHKLYKVKDVDQIKQWKCSWVQAYIKSSTKGNDGVQRSTIYSGQQDWTIESPEAVEPGRPSIAIYHRVGNGGKLYVFANPELMVEHPMDREFPAQLLKVQDFPNKKNQGFCYAYPSQRYKKRRDGYEVNATPVLCPEPHVVNVDVPIEEEGYYYFGFIKSDGGGTEKDVYTWKYAEEIEEKIRQKNSGVKV